MLPVNLLALDSAHFDANLKAGQGVQPPDTGFGAAFGSLMQAPETSAGPLAAFPPGSDALASWPVPGGEVLPQTGNALPPEGAVVLPEMEPAAGDIPENLLAPDALAPTALDLPGARAQVAQAAIEPGVPPLPAGIPAAPTDTGNPTAAAAVPVASLGTGTGPETKFGADAAHSGLLQHIRYLEPGTGVQTRPVAETAPSVALQRPDMQLIPPPISTTPQGMTGTPKPALQVTDATQSSNALMPTGPDASLPGEVQDLKAQPPASPLASLATIKAPSAAAAAQPPAAPMQWTASSIDVAPGQAGWDEALGDRVTWMAGNRIQNAELRLNPAELGPLRVQISMDDGNASVTFTAQHPLTRDAIEQALPRLREMLADQGLSLQNASVSDHGSRHQQAGPGGERFAPRFGSGPGADGGMTEGEDLPPVVQRTPGLVDVFA